MQKRKGKKHLHFGHYLGFVLVVITLIVLGLIFFINLLPTQFLGLLAVILGIIDLIVIKLLLSKKNMVIVLGSIISIVLIIFMVLGINNELTTINFFKQFGFKSYKTDNYNVVVLSDSTYNEIKDLQNKTIGHILLKNNASLEESINKLKSVITNHFKEYADTSVLINELMEQNVDAIILKDIDLEMLAEEDEEDFAKLKIIYTIEIETKIKEIGKDVNILKEPFNIYISGLDTYGSITKASRSDVNMVVSVNPNTKNILLTSIPRDYYVPLHGINEYDKLTHAGIYGIEMSVGTIEDLLDTTLNYYVKVNFTTLINIVDALGGITVNSKYDFTTVDGYHFTKGENKLNGEEALSFSRERKAFQEGDRTRGENQELVLEAIINKAMSPGIIKSYDDVLKALNGNFITNLDDAKIREFIKKQIDDANGYQINSLSLNGTNAYETTYSYRRNPLYVMKPSLESVNNAKEQIVKVLK